jgi:hypothetical protein
LLRLVLAVVELRDLAVQRLGQCLRIAEVAVEVDLDKKQGEVLVVLLSTPVET